MVVILSPICMGFVELPHLAIAQPGVPSPFLLGKSFKGFQVNTDKLMIFVR